MNPVPAGDRNSDICIQDAPAKRNKAAFLHKTMVWEPKHGLGINV